LWLGHKPQLLRRVFQRGKRWDGTFDHPDDRLAQKGLRRVPGQPGDARKPAREIWRNLHDLSFIDQPAGDHTTLWSTGEGRLHRVP
jgi:hypothetical protein